MYSGSGFSDWEIGDITVILHKGIYHLYHLIIPNHDYIAHAISRNGISWRRVNNALFVGNPGEWDDDMLWTMHVVEEGNKFMMYYTGLQRRDRGVVSRIGLAESSNLLDWKKCNNGVFPIEPMGIHYEAANANPRTWLSFRDPFRFDHAGKSYLLVCARSLYGPVSRRGCVGLVEITGGKVERMPALLYPMMYDDIECPCVFRLKDRFYILGSIREDIKVRYWFSPDFVGEYHSFHDDVLLPQGNYAARTVEDGPHILIFNFFYVGKIDALRVLPPPKQLDADERGRLVLRSYYRWEHMASDAVAQADFGPVRKLLGNATANATLDSGKWICGSRSGFEIFTFKRPSQSFIWDGLLTVEGMGKLGIVTDADNNGSGYFISFDVSNGVVQADAWGHDPVNFRRDFIFDTIQLNVFAINPNRSFRFRLIRYGHYIELSIDGIVKITMMDYRYTKGDIGLFSASSVISLQDSWFRTLPDPEDEYASQEETQRPPVVAPT